MYADVGRAREGAQWVEVLVAKPGGLSPETTWWEERANSHKLFPDLHMCVTYTPTLCIPNK